MNEESPSCESREPEIQKQFTALDKAIEQTGAAIKDLVSRLDSSGVLRPLPIEQPSAEKTHESVCPMGNLISEYVERLKNIRDVGYATMERLGA